MTKTPAAEKGKKKQRNEDDRIKYAAKKQGSVLTVDEFAHRRGDSKGLQSFRARKESKRLRTAKQLRSYQRAMKREGFEPGTGASRKRTAVATAAGDAEDGKTPPAVQPTEVDEDAVGSIDATKKQSAVNVAHATATRAIGGRKKRGSTLPFAPSSTKQSDAQARHEKREALHAERAAQKEAALKQRRRRHQLLTARTSRGQPIMKNLVQDILHQLQSAGTK